MFEGENDPRLLPVLPAKYLTDGEGGFKLNPFTYLGKTFRIVGYDMEADSYSIKDEDENTFKWKTAVWINAITGVWKQVKFRRASRGYTDRAVKLNCAITCWIPRQYILNWPEGETKPPLEVLAAVPNWFLEKNDILEKYLKV